MPGLFDGELPPKCPLCGGAHRPDYPGCVGLKDSNALARNTDPETSHDLAETIRMTKGLGGKDRAIYIDVRDHPGTTTRASHHRLRWLMPDRTTHSPRFARLADDKGLLVRSQWESPSVVETAKPLWRTTWAICWFVTGAELIQPSGSRLRKEWRK